MSRTLRPFHDLETIAHRLGVPAAWLKAQAAAGVVPHIKAGRKRLAHVEDVERALDGIKKEDTEFQYEIEMPPPAK